MRMKTGTCKFCNQVTQISTEENLTQQQADEAATMQCKCEGAKEHRKRKKRKESAIRNILALFGEDAPPGKKMKEIEGILRMALDEICAGRVKKITLNIGDDTKASASQNSKGEISVKRTETKKKKITE